MATALFYTDFACDPFFNMAFDEWLFRRALSEQSSIYIRLYSWSPGGITFGLNQRLETALDFSLVGDTPVIRRITGGRALYHDPSELTYCVVVNCDGWSNTDRFDSVSSVSEDLSEALMSFLSRIGIDSERVKPGRAGRKEAQMLHTAPCFASNARHEIISGGRKIIASAQRQSEKVILQHGAIKINSVAAHPALASVIDESAQGQEIQPLTESVFGRMTEPFRESFSVFCGLDITPSNLSSGERKALLCEAEELREKGRQRREITKQTESVYSL